MSFGKHPVDIHFLSLISSACLI